jgi:hypothetical protein
MSDTGILCPATIGKRPVALPWAGLIFRFADGDALDLDYLDYH